MASVLRTQNEQEISRLNAFYEAIYNAQRPIAAGGSNKLTQSVILRAAADHLTGIRPALRRWALEDIASALGDKVPGVIRESIADNARNRPARFLRPQNGYIALVTPKAMENAAMVPALEQEVLLKARRLALSTAIESQISTMGSEEKMSARSDLLRLVNNAASVGACDLLREGWPLIVVGFETGEASISKDGLEALHRAVDIAPALLSREQIEVALAPVRSAIRGQRTEINAINGKSSEEVHREVDELVLLHGAGRRIFDSNKIRVDEYRRTVARINANRLVKEVMPQVEAMMKEQELEARAEQAAAGGLVLDGEDLKELGPAHPYADALFELTQECGKKLGFTKEVTLVITPHVLPNAYVYTADHNNPRVTFFTPMIEKFWDNDKNDWVRIWLDPAGQPTVEGAAGATLVPVGRLLVESVLAHELGHIRDQIMTLDSVLIFLFLAMGTNLARAAAEKGNLEEQRKIERLMVDTTEHMTSCGVFNPAGKIKLPDFGRSAALDEKALLGVMRLLDEEVLADQPRAASELVGASLTFADLFRFIEALKRIGRAAEATADRYAVAVQGGAQWTALMDTILGLHLAVSVTEEGKRKSIEGLMKMGPEAYANRALERLSGKDAPANVDFDKERSHPTSTVRVRLDYEFERDKDGIFAEIRKLDTLSPDLRLLGIIQLFENECIEHDTVLRNTKPHNTYAPLDGIKKQGDARAKIRELTNAMHPFLDYVDELIGERGLAQEGNEFVNRALSFMEDRGVKLADNVPFKRLAAHLKLDLLELTTGELSEGERAVVQGRLKRVDDILGKEADDAVNEAKATRARKTAALFAEQTARAKNHAHCRHEHGESRAA